MLVLTESALGFESFNLNLLNSDKIKQLYDLKEARQINSRSSNDNKVYSPFKKKDVLYHLLVTVFVFIKQLQKVFIHCLHK